MKASEDKFETEFKKIYDFVTKNKSVNSPVTSTEESNSSGE